MDCPNKNCLWITFLIHLGAYVLSAEIGAIKRQYNWISFLFDIDTEQVAEELDNLTHIDTSRPSRTQRGISELDGQDYDLLDDIEKHKDIYRLKVAQFSLYFPYILIYVK